MKNNEDKIIKDLVSKYKDMIIKEMLEEENLSGEFIKLMDLEGKCRDIIEEMEAVDEDQIQTEILSDFIKTSKSFTHDQSEYMLLKGIELGIAMGKISTGKERNFLQ